MIINMSCPKCGAQASEYDEHKWQCLKCGNKFILSPEAPSHTYFQNTVNIHGRAMYELDVSTVRHAVTKIVRAGEYEPETFEAKFTTYNTELSECQRAVMKQKVQTIVWTIVSVISGIIAGVLAVNLAMGTIAVVSAVFAWKQFQKMMSSRHRIQQIENGIADLKLEEQQEMSIGYDILCPHCQNLFESVVGPDAVSPEGLVHCLKCGKQFFIQEGDSYPVVFK